MKHPFKPKILIVDKNAGGSFLLTSILKDWGHETFSVNSFLKAIEYCKNSYTPDLIIVEMQETAESFFDFPKKFEQRTGKKIPIIVHSNLLEKEIIQNAIKSGYVDYLVRPVEPDILLDKISNIINPDLVLNENTFNFNLNEEAKILCPVHLDSINEFGIQGSVPFQLTIGTFISISSPTLNSHGLNELKVKVVEIQPNQKANLVSYPFAVKFSFVGLSFNESNKLRKIAMFKGVAA